MRKEMLLVEWSGNWFITMVNFPGHTGEGWSLSPLFLESSQTNTVKLNFNMKNMIQFENLALAELDMPGCKNIS